MSRFEFRVASPDDAPRVEAFNQRLAAAGERYHRLSLEKPFRTMAHLEDSPITVEKLFCLDGNEIRGGVGIKRMMFRVNGRPEEVAVSVYPLSEGIVNPAFARVGVLLQTEMSRRYPLMYSLIAGNARRYSTWFNLPVPFHFAVMRPGPFLRNVAQLRNREWMSRLLDVVVASGGAAAGLKAWEQFQRLRGRYPAQAGLTIERFDWWGDWADEVWQASRDRYSLIGDRSRATLRSLYPDGHEHLIRLCVQATDPRRLLGWAVVTAATMKDHKYFGNMRLGALVDMLAAPEDAHAVVSGALAAARHAGADAVIANHSDRRWNDALERAGMVPWRTNLFLFLSPHLRERFNPIEEYADRFFFTRGDGHGPTSLWSADYHSSTHG